MSKNAVINHSYVSCSRSQSILSFLLFQRFFQFLFVTINIYHIFIEKQNHNVEKGNEMNWNETKKEKNSVNKCDCHMYKYVLDMVCGLGCATIWTRHWTTSLRTIDFRIHDVHVIQANYIIPYIATNGLWTVDARYVKIIISQFDRPV